MLLVVFLNTLDPASLVLLIKHVNCLRAMLTGFSKQSEAFRKVWDCRQLLPLTWLNSRCYSYQRISIADFGAF